MNNELPIYIVVGDNDYRLIYEVYNEHWENNNVSVIRNGKLTGVHYYSQKMLKLIRESKKQHDNTIECNTTTV